MTHGHLFNPSLSKSGYKKRENRVLGKQVLAELRLANDFFGDFCLNTLYF